MHRVGARAMQRPLSSLTAGPQRSLGTGRGQGWYCHLSGVPSSGQHNGLAVLRQLAGR